MALLLQRSLPPHPTLAHHAFHPQQLHKCFSYSFVCQVAVGASVSPEGSTLRSPFRLLCLLLPALHCSPETALASPWGCLPSFTSSRGFLRKAGGHWGRGSAAVLKALVSISFNESDGGAGLMGRPVVSGTQAPSAMSCHPWGLPSVWCTTTCLCVRAPGRKAVEGTPARPFATPAWGGRAQLADGPC